MPFDLRALLLLVSQVVDVGHMEPHLDLNAPGGYEEAAHYAAQQAAYAQQAVEEHAAAQQQAMADPAQPMKTCRRCCVRLLRPLRGCNCMPETCGFQQTTEWLTIVSTFCQPYPPRSIV